MSPADKHADPQPQAPGPAAVGPTCQDTNTPATQQERAVPRRTVLRTLCAGLLSLGGVGGGLALAHGHEPAASGAKPTKRYALAIDLARCAHRDGCRACIEACHAAHNVPLSAQSGREVRWIWKERFEQAFPTEVHEAMSSTRRAQPVPVLCNHCANPPCVRVCPTQATFRRADGIVMMDEHRCIGCRYCVAACPYGARSFNWQDPRTQLAKVNPHYPTRAMGVVEKCTFCAKRVDKGLLPLCVEVCSSLGTGALTFGDLDAPNSPLARLLDQRTVLRRKPALSTSPGVFYLL
ncbi:MAG: 4Fe-4S dicluster domain-containing protein [Polyangiaceae bacterium]|nr:4Fe-4S dicluster domain-containing protein [Polyangiaceae bacterium]